MILLLLANGYELRLEQQPSLDRALQLRRRDLLDLLLAWGANPLEVSVDVLCDTYDTELYERFRTLGLDLTKKHELACALGYHTSNKPLFGFPKRHREEEPSIQRELDIAVAHHASEGNEKGVLLCLWAEPTRTLGSRPCAGVLATEMKMTTTRARVGRTPRAGADERRRDS